MAIDDETLINAAVATRELAYSRYSGYLVGAALEDDEGRLHVGCNVENAAYPLGTCAEAGAISTMVAAGGRRIVAIAVAGGRDAPDACTPCGGCRQRIHEFAGDDTRVLLYDGAGWRPWTIAELLPEGFSLKVP